MLYISRWLSDARVGVADTDDGVEELLDISALSHVVNRGVTIEGISFMTPPVPGKITPPIRDIAAYQPEETKAEWQKRVALLLGVEVCVYDSTIVHINWETPMFKSGTKFRPSQFCKKIGYTIFGFSSFTNSSKTITLVLDDSLEVDANAFRSLYRAKAVIDLREVTNDETVTAVYAAATASHAKTFDKFIIDHDVRRSSYEKASERWHRMHQKRQFTVR